jgi:DNA-3-methyladenine glycosylase II
MGVSTATVPIVTSPPAPPPLTEESLHAAVTDLAAMDPDLARVVERFGPPPLWDRQPGFSTLVQIILEQQVSLSSARAAYERLVAALGAEPAPDTFLVLGDDQLLRIGFSRQKARYVRELARASADGSIDIDGLARLPDEEALTALLARPGIGPWTATIYLLMVLCRPDVWPAGDMALATAVAELKGLDRRPGPDELTALAEAWRPWRAVAARLLWHHYLAVRGRA